MWPTYGGLNFKLHLVAIAFKKLYILYRVLLKLRPLNCLYCSFEATLKTENKRGKLLLTQTIAQDKYNIHRSETIVGSFFMSTQFQKLVSTFFKNKVKVKKIQK